MLANEQSKARATRNGAPRSRLSWRLLFLSAGELGLADHMAEGQKRARTGQEVRMADIPADAGKGLGAFECLHGHAGGAEFSKYLTGQAATVYGAAGRAWLQWLTDHADALKARIKAGVARVVASYVPEGASGQVDRVAARFALVGVAGEIATEAGLTGWKEGESEAAAKACFDAWLAARGGAANGEVYAILRQFKSNLELHGEGRFTWYHRAHDDHNAKTLERWGFRRLVTEDGKPIKHDSDFQREFGDVKSLPAMYADTVSTEYLILPGAFQNHLCPGYNWQTVARVLLEHGCLVPDKGRQFDCKPRLPLNGGTPARCYRVTSSIFALEV